MIEVELRGRKQFEGLLLTDKRWSIAVAHRRAGKTVACVQKLVKAALECEKREPRFAYIAPLYKQAKDVAWSYLKEHARALGISPNESELRIDLPNGSRVRLYGADNPDSLRGIYLDGVILDEYADMRPGLWSEVIRPALSDRKGWATFIGTPKGHNDFYDLWQMAQQDERWFALMLRASETGLIDDAELADARRIMSEDEYGQEYECSFEAAIRGAFYGEQLKNARTEGRIAKIPIDKNLGVWTAWDLGITDATAIWFGQTFGFEERIIDYYEASGVGLDHYAQVLREKGYNYTAHYLPHDVDVKSLSTGISRRATLEGLGLEVTVVPMHSVMDGINATRRYLDRCWFDEERCKRGIEALTQYRREYDEKNRAFKKNPLHDWTSHAADALRYRAATMDYDLPKRERAYSSHRRRRSTSWMAS